MGRSILRHLFLAVVLALFAATPIRHGCGPRNFSTMG